MSTNISGISCLSVRISSLTLICLRFSSVIATYVLQLIFKYLKIVEKHCLCNDVPNIPR